MLNVYKVCLFYSITFWRKLYYHHNSASFSTTGGSLYTVTPLQVQQSIEQLVAAKIWMSIFSFYNFFFNLQTHLIAGKIGQSQGGFQQTNGESPVTKVVTEWRLNVGIILFL